jgi:glyoxylase-like metal-dependent hydrolase (beta-lactamase superfamily II)
VGQSRVVVPDKATVDAHVTRAEYILLTHSHVDHILDAPYIASKTGAMVRGDTFRVAAGDVMQSSEETTGKR